MFRFLNRLLKAAVVLGWLGGAALLWSQREHGQPAADFFFAWRDAGWKEPDPLPVITGTVTRALGEATLEVKTDDGTTYRLGLAGIDARDPAPIAPARRRDLAAASRQELEARVAGRRVECRCPLLNSDHSGLAYFQLEGASTSLNSELVAEGRHRLQPAVIGVLPILEQVRLRLADRQARGARRGIWATEAGAPDSSTP